LYACANILPFFGNQCYCLCALSPTTTRSLTTFLPISSAFSLSSAISHSHSQSALLLRWTALRFLGFLSIIYLGSYIFDYSSSSLLGACHTLRACARAPSYLLHTALALSPHPRRCLPASRPHDTYIPQLTCYVGRQCHTFVKFAFSHYVGAPPLYLLLFLLSPSAP